MSWRKAYPWVSRRPGASWTYGYDTSLRLWVGLELDKADCCIVQENGEEAVYGETRKVLITYINEYNRASLEANPVRHCADCCLVTQEAVAIEDPWGGIHGYLCEECNDKRAEALTEGG